MKRAVPPAAVFAAGVVATGVCVAYRALHVRPAWCADHELYVACFATEGEHPTVTIRNRSSAPLVLFTQRSAYVVQVGSLLGSGPAPRDRLIEAERTRMARLKAAPLSEAPEAMTLVAPGGTYTLTPDPDLTIAPFERFDLSLRAWRTSGPLPESLRAYRVIDFSRDDGVQP